MRTKDERHLISGGGGGKSWSTSSYTSERSRAHTDQSTAEPWRITCWKVDVCVHLLTVAVKTAENRKNTHTIWAQTFETTKKGLSVSLALTCRAGRWSRCRRTLPGWRAVLQKGGRSGRLDRGFSASLLRNPRPRRSYWCSRLQR